MAKQSETRVSAWGTLDNETRSIVSNMRDEKGYPLEPEFDPDWTPYPGATKSWPLGESWRDGSVHIFRGDIKIGYEREGRIFDTPEEADAYAKLRAKERRAEKHSAHRWPASARWTTWILVGLFVGSLLASIQLSQEVISLHEQLTRSINDLQHLIERTNR